MSKIRIIDPNWRNFTGDFGGVEFVDNVSVEDVHQRDARRLADLIQIENVEDGTNPSNAQVNLDRQGTPMKVVAEGVNSGQLDGKIERVYYTRDQLTAIADEKGIDGLRKIGVKFNVNSRSIKGLLDAIVAAQSGDPDAPQLSLIGSALQPSEFEVEGKKVTLGEVVRNAFDAWANEPGNQKIGEMDWNNLPNEVREDHIHRAVQRIYNPPAPKVATPE